jgi:hypothetical protein
VGDSQYGLPYLIGNLTESTARGLKRVRMTKGGEAGYNERWLQDLVSRHPNILPIDQIEPALTPVIPVCMELPVASGFVDNLFTTPDGDLIVAETKLFRNPEARREVIGQIIDYAKDLSLMSYEQLDAAIKRADAPDGSRTRPRTTLFGAVTEFVGEDGVNEEQFVDAVTRNLERGRFLLLVIGDGIQLGTENITGFLQQHAGIHFTFGLVELAVFELPADVGHYLVQPRVLAKTRNIDRGIVTIDNGRIVAKASTAPASGTDGQTAKRTSLSEEKFFELLGSNHPTVVPKLKGFAERLADLSVVTEFGTKSMSLKWQPDEKRSWNLGAITMSGEVNMDYLGGAADTAGLLDLAHQYLRKVAALVPGGYVKQTPNPIYWRVLKGNSPIPITDMMAVSDGWYDVIRWFTGASLEALKQQ